MAIQFQRLATPGDGVSTLLDFAPLAAGIQTYQNNEKAALIGNAARTGGNTLAAQEAMNQGQLDTGAQYQRLAMQDKKSAQMDKDRQIKILGSGAAAALAEKDPARAQMIWDSMIKRAGVNPADMDPEELDVRTGPKAFQALAGQFQDPRESQLMDLKLKEANLNIQDKNQNLANRKRFIDALGGNASDAFANIPDQVRKAALLRAQAGDVDGALDLISKASTPTPLSVAEKKQVFSSEDDALLYKNQIDTLDQALKLISEDAEKKGTAAYEGIGAGAAGYIGAMVPFGDAVFDGTRSKATSEYDNIMSLEAIKSMSELLKGATTDRELAEFQRILSDPSQPRSIRRGVIGRMKTLLQQKANLADRRSKDLRSGDYFRGGNSGGGGTPTLDQMSDEELLQELGR